MYINRYNIHLTKPVSLKPLKLDFYELLNNPAFDTAHFYDRNDIFQDTLPLTETFIFLLL